MPANYSEYRIEQVNDRGLYRVYPTSNPWYTVMITSQEVLEDLGLWDTIGND